MAIAQLQKLDKYQRSDIYERCNVAVLEPADYTEAEKDPKWIAAMKDELNLIEMNQTWELVSRP